MLTLMLAESALELIPPELRKVRSIVAQSRQKGCEPDEILLDRSYHHKAMLALKDASRRGRPDIVHFSLLEATATPLYVKGFLDVYVHTCRDMVVEVSSGVRLPKTYARFEGIMTQLFADRRVPKKGEALLRLSEKRFPTLVSELKPSCTFGLSRVGKNSSFQEVASRLAAEERPVVVVGGFPRGHFSDPVREVMNEVYSVCEMSLEAHVVVARLLYEFEKCLRMVC